MSKWNSETLRVVIPDGATLGPAQYRDGKMILQATGDLLGNVTLLPESKA